MSGKTNWYIKFCFLLSLIYSCNSKKRIGCEEYLSYYKDKVNKQHSLADTMNLINEIEQESDNQNCIALTLFKADIYYACGQNKKAELNYNKIVSVDSSNQKAIYKIALLLYDKENYDSSIVLLKKLIGLKSSGSFVMDINKNLDKESTEIYSEEIAFYLGLDYYYRTDLQNALNNFNYCIQHNFRLGDSYLYRGEIFAETNNSEKACRDFDSARYFGNKRVDSYIIKYCN